MTRSNWLLGLLLTFALAITANARNPQGSLQVGTLCSGLITTGTSPAATSGVARAGEKTFQAVVSGSGSVSATVLIQASNDPVNDGWVTLGTITLPSTSTTVTDGFSSQSGWAYYQCDVTAISGTGATVQVTVAQE